MRSALRFIFCLVSFLLAETCNAQIAYNITEIGSLQLPSEAWDMVMSGDYLYVATRDSGLLIVDISNPVDPTIRGSLIPQVANFTELTLAIKVEGRYAYMGVVDMLQDSIASGGLRIIDIENPEQPTEVGFFNTGESTDGIYVRDGLAYLVGNQADFRVVNISAPNNPQQIGIFDMLGAVTDVTVVGHYAYVANRDRGVRAIDISDPANLSEVGNWRRYGASVPFRIFNLGSNLYVIGYDPELWVIDCSDPANMRQAGIFSEPGSGTAWQASLVCDRIIVAKHGYMLQVVSLSDLEHPARAGYFYGRGRFKCVTATDNYAFATSKGVDCCLGVYDISGAYPYAGELREQTLTFRRGWNLVSLNILPHDIFYSALGIDIRRFANQPIAERTLRDYLYLVKDQAGHFYSPFNDFQNLTPWKFPEGIQIKLTQDIQATWTGEPIQAEHNLPLQQGWNFAAYFPTYPLNASAPDFYALSSIIEHVIMAKDAQGRFMSPSSHYSNMQDWTAGQAYQIKVDQNVVLNYPPERRQMKLVSAMAPCVHFITPDPTGRNMSLLIESRAALEGEIGAFDPTGRLIGATATQGVGPFGFAIWGDDPTTSLIDGAIEGEPLLFKLWDGKTECVISPTWIEGDGRYRTDEFSLGEIIISSASDETLPTELTLQAIHPNPFNSQATIRFALSEAAGIKLSLFDLSGRETAVIAEGHFKSGWNSATLSAASLPTGIYYVRLLSSGSRRTTKAVVVK